MTVRLYADPTHKAVVFSYSTHEVQGDFIDIRAVNADTGDVGTKRAFNNPDGLFVLAYPLDFAGTDEITVTGSDGGEHTGTVEIP